MSILEKISSLSKRRGFIYPSSEIYGGITGMWDYGPLGVELKNNIKREYWKNIVQERSNVVGIDSSILMNPKVWEASGHVESFVDPLVECKKCKKRFRADHLEEAGVKECPKCKGELGEPREFNLLVEAYLGAVEGSKQKAYLRGEITQGVHTNFKQVVDSTRVDIPFGIAQIGKAFRNEITPGKLTFRSREFEQMELQFFIKPEEKESKKWFDYWKEERMKWYLELGINKENVRFREHKEDELAHYAKEAWDIEYNLDDEWLEFEGVHHRGEWDLGNHQKHSGQSMEWKDRQTNEKFIPWVIETSGGVDRATLFFLVDAYKEEELEDGKTRTVLKLHPKIAPYKAAVFPLLSNKEELVEKAKSVYDSLKKDFMINWDDRGNIGKRYRYQDEMGTPACITIDFDSLEDNTVTIRDRDTMKQERVKIEDIKNYL
ncbi:MAG: glycine--tRNA ligase, partial [Candidatus Paceibacterota bacterium]